jgi:methylmalonyl-CoA mutase N-terminal domain/subunit
MTSRIERDVLAELGRIDAQGGTLAAVESGYIQNAIHESAYRAQREVDAGRAVVVGVNRFVDDTPAEGPQTFTLDPEVEREQVERLGALRVGRSVEPWRAALDAVKAAALDGTNLVPPIITAVQQQATIGEIADTLRGIFGEHRDAR